MSTAMSTGGAGRVLGPQRGGQFANGRPLRRVPLGRHGAVRGELRVAPAGDPQARHVDGHAPVEYVDLRTVLAVQVLDGPLRGGGVVVAADPHVGGRRGP